MKTASVTKSKNGLGNLLRVVKGGKGVLIFDRNVPAARLEPLMAGTLPNDARLRELERQGLIRRSLQSGSLFDALTTPRPKPRRAASLVAALLAERNEAAR